MWRALFGVCWIWLLVDITSARRVLPRTLFPGDTSTEQTSGNYRKIRHLKHGRDDNRPPETVIARSREEHLVTALPGLQDGDFPTKHYAGHVPVEEGFMFYWLFESSTSDPDADPLLIWLNGGPGCSSMDGLWLENGPFRLGSEDYIVINPYSWHNVANIMYVDQPLGTGLSYTTESNYAEDDQQIDSQFYLFLCNFLELHPNLKSRPVYFSGESHAGHYIPSMISFILNKNAEVMAAGQGGLVIDVRGMAIGNGWVDPINQYDVSDYAFGMGLIDAGQRRAMKRKEAMCIKSLKSQNYHDPLCLSLMDDIVNDSGGKLTGVPRVSMYDVRHFELGRSFPPGHVAVEAYLNRQDVREAVHAASCPIRFEECTDPPYLHLAKWDGLGVTNELRTLLDKGIQTLFYNGQYDLICNHVGNQKLLMKLGGWKGAKEWEASTRGVWFAGTRDDNNGQSSRTVGYVKEAVGNPLTFLLVLDAGHMVPLDLPSHALNMITRFLRGEPFTDKAQNVLESLSCPDAPEGEDGKADAGNPGGIYPDCGAGSGASYLLEVGAAEAAKYGSVVASAAKTPPDIVGTPVPGSHSVTVNFAPGELDVKLGAVEYRVESSPEGISSIGSGSPITVDDLTPGRTYTFSVSAAYTQDENGVAFGDGIIVRSVPSVGSAAVTPGCVSQPAGVRSDADTVQAGDSSEIPVPVEVCSGHGVCREGGPGGTCVCHQGYGGESCELVVAGDTRGGGGGVDGMEEPQEADAALTIKALEEGDFPMLKSDDWKVGPCEMELRFQLRPQAFRDSDFVFAIVSSSAAQKSSPSWESGDADNPPPVLTSRDRNDMEGMSQGFSTLLRADVGRAVGVSIDAVAVGGVAPEHGLQPRSGSWRDWAAGSLNVSVVVMTDSPRVTAAEFMSEWNGADSRLHTGMISSLIDFSKAPEMAVTRLERIKISKYSGPAPLVSILYLICFALAVPVCGCSRPCLARRKRGFPWPDLSALGSGGWGMRRGWRAPVGGGTVGRGVGEPDYEAEPLAERDDGYEWGMTTRERVKGSAGDMW